MELEITRKPTVAAVVVTYNRKALLRDCLNSLLTQTLGLDAIIVVNNASTDGTGDMLAQEFPNLTILTMEKNLGSSGGFYEGMKHAYKLDYDWIWVMDDDSLPAQNALEELLKPLHGDWGNDNQLVLSSQVIDPDGQVIEWYHRYFNPVRITERNAWPNQYGDQPFKIDIASFVSMCVNRDVIAKIGLPIQWFFIWYDDTEYSLRIRKANATILVVPKSVVKHPRGVKSDQRSVARHKPLDWKTYYGFRNRTITYYLYSKNIFIYIANLFYNTLRSITGVLLYRPNKKQSIVYLLKGVFSALSSIFHHRCYSQPVE